MPLCLIYLATGDEQHRFMHLIEKNIMAKVLIHIGMFGNGCLLRQIRGKNQLVHSKPMVRLQLGWIYFHKAIRKSKRTFGDESLFITLKGIKLLANKP
jgi:hypothetical protein